MNGKQGTAVRDLQPALVQAATQLPVVTLTGPRQSGKTTLCRSVFGEHAYVSLEAADTRQFAREDPRGFLAQFAGGVLLDEFHRAPELAGYLQGIVDEDPAPGRFILTGSQNLAISESVSQSLAGRTALLTLLPLSYAELRRFDGAPKNLFAVMLQGGYPRIAQMHLDPVGWLSAYTQTYLERDVRNLANVGDLEAFQTFTGLAAGRSAQEQNLSQIGADAGVSHNTARKWLSVLEAGYLIHRLPAWHRNVRKQISKSPKLHFIDSGVLCRLLNIRDTDQLRNHPLIGAIFETWVVSELLKGHMNAGRVPRLRHYRESRGLEIDVVDETLGALRAIEIKSAATLTSRFFQPLQRLREQVGETPMSPHIVYGGDTAQTRHGIPATPWSSTASVCEDITAA